LTEFIKEKLHAIDVLGIKVCAIKLLLRNGIHRKNPQKKTGRIRALKYANRLIQILNF